MSVRMGPSGQVPHLRYPFVGGNHRRLVGRLELGSGDLLQRCDLRVGVP